MFDLNSFAADNLPFIKKYAECFNLSHHDAEDLASTVMLDFVKKYENGRVDIANNPRAYLSKLARWRITDRARENIRASKTFQEIGENNDLDSLPKETKSREREQIEIIKLALKSVYKDKKARKNKCSDRDCEIFRLTVLEEISAEEVAKTLKTTKPTVYLARHRVGNQIKNLIKQWNLNSQY